LLLALNGLRSTTELRARSQIKTLELAIPSIASSLSPRSPDQI
jgi:hypothetical protein